MTNKNFNKLLNRVASANAKYKKLLDEAENEFIRRYGNHPSDIDFDSWIDIYHIGNGGILTAEEIDKEMQQEVYKHYEKSDEQN